MNIKIEKGIPAPYLGSRMKYNELSNLLKSLEVGDSFIYPADRAASLRGVAFRLGINITARREKKGNFRIWRIADKVKGGDKS